MAQSRLDAEIIRLLQNQGLIKREAQRYLKQHVYTLHADEVAKIKKYATHFGIQAKQTLIDEILELRREQLRAQLLTNAR